MSDQADDLRALVLRGGSPWHDATPAPRMIAVRGGKGGVGVTTVAVNLAVALALDGRRTVLVDADLEGAHVSQLCGLHESATIADVLDGRRTLHEALELGPVGTQVLPGARTRTNAPEVSDSATQRLLRQLEQLGAHADYIVLDLGRGTTRLSQRLTQAADGIVMTTTPDATAVMDTYAALKSLVPSESPPLWLLVNRTNDLRTANDVQGRFARACRRFLGWQVMNAGDLPEEPLFAETATLGRPLVVDYERRPAAMRCLQLAAKLVAALDPAHESAFKTTQPTVATIAGAKS